VTNAAATPEDHYASICKAFLDQPDVSQPSDNSRSRKTFGSSALRIHNRIFAMLVSGKLVVKLPAGRVDALIASGAGQRFETGPSRRLKEWLSLDPAVADTWLPLAQEALEFVAHGAGGG